jgi:hypothetical protein
LPRIGDDCGGSGRGYGRGNAVVLGLVVLAWTRGLAAEPLQVINNGIPRFVVSVPEECRSVSSGAEGDVLAQFTCGDGPESSVAVLLVRLEGRWSQGPLDSTRRAELVRADPFPFRDAVISFRTLGVKVEGLRGESNEAGRRAVRLAAPVPLTEGTLGVTVFGAREAEPQVRRTLSFILASVQARTHWLTPVRRVLAWATSIGLIVGLAVSVLYILLAQWVFRRNDRWPRVRGAALVLAGTGWLAPAIWLITATGVFVKVTGALIGIFGLLLGARGVEIWRTRTDRTSVDQRV